MFFPVAGIEVNPLLPPLVALAVSYFCSMAGISGGFMLLPFQVSVLGYSSPSVSATNQFFNIVATPGGIYRYFREGRMLWPLALVILAGTFPGVFIGALVRVTCLTDLGRFKLFVALVLAYMGYRVLKSLLAGRKGDSPARQSRFEEKFRAAALDGKHTTNARTAVNEAPVNETREACEPGELGEQGEPGGQVSERLAERAAGRLSSLAEAFVVSNARATFHSISYEFGGAVFSVPTAGVLLLSFMVGIVGGIYGVGGGALITPVLVSFYNLPIYTITASSLLATFGTSLFGVLFFMLLAPLFPGQNIAPDFALGLLFGLGGLAGMYLGARTQKYVPAVYIKWGIAVAVLATAAKYAADFFTAL